MATSKLILIGWVLFSCTLAFYLFFKNKNYKVTFSFILGFMFLTLILFQNSDGMRIRKYKITLQAMTLFVQDATRNLISRLKGEEVRFDYAPIDHSLHERLTLLDGLVSIIKDNWLIGTGAGSLKEKFAIQAGHKLTLETPHFYFFELLTKYGIIFLCVYFFWLIRVFFKLSKINFFYASSLGLIVLFNPVVPSQIYFLPKWALYAFFVKVIDNSHLPLKN